MPTAGLGSYRLIQFLEINLLSELIWFQNTHLRPITQMSLLARLSVKSQKHGFSYFCNLQMSAIRLRGIHLTVFQKLFWGPFLSEQVSNNKLFPWKPCLSLPYLILKKNEHLTWIISELPAKGDSESLLIYYKQSQQKPHSLGQQQLLQIAPFACCSPHDHLLAKPCKVTVRCKPNRRVEKYKIT